VSTAPVVLTITGGAAVPCSPDAAGHLPSPHVAPKPRHAPLVAEALAMFNLAVNLDERTDEIDKLVIDKVIEHHASLGNRFSANDLREDLPAVRTLLISRRLIVAQHEGRIEKVGYTPSTLASTKGAVVAVYRPLDTFPVEEYDA